MGLTLLPAVDVAGGEVLRAGRDDGGRTTVGLHPIDVVRTWQAGGATWIHLVDVDAALGRGENAELLASVIAALDLGAHRVEVQLSAGIDDDRGLDRALAAGCARAVISTAALDDPAWCTHTIEKHGARIAVALDVRVVERPDGMREHRLAPRGHDHDRDIGDLWAMLAILDRAGCSRYVVTDVDRDGALVGPNLDLCRAVLKASSTPVIASGGVASLDDLCALAGLSEGGVALEGAVVGGALHAGRFTVPDALAALARSEASETST